MKQEVIYSSEKRDKIINESSNRTFTQMDCIDFLDTLGDSSIDLIVIDPPYNVLASNKKDTSGVSLYHTRYKVEVSPSESDFKKGLVDRKSFDISIPWEEQRSLEDYKFWCSDWYKKAYNKLKDDSFIFIFWSMKYLHLAYEIFDVSRVVFWQQPNMVSNISGDFSYDVTPIIIVRKGNAKLNKDAKLWDKTNVFKFAKPQGNYKNDKLTHNCQKPRKLLEHLVWLSDKDHENNTILDFFAGSGSILRAVDKADVMLCDMNTDYFDKFFDTYKHDTRVSSCKKIKK